MQRFGISALTAALAVAGFLTRAATTLEFDTKATERTEGELTYISLVVSPFPPPENVTYRIHVIGGTATGDDFRWVLGGTDPEVIYPSEFQSRPFLLLSAVDDGLHEPDESIQLGLEVVSGAVPGLRTNHTVIIHNLAPRLTLSGALGDEASGAGLVVSRGGDVDVPVSADWTTTEGGTAVPGVDFLPTNGVVTIPAGEREVRFTVPWIDNGTLNSSKSVSVRLSNPSSGASLSYGPMVTNAYVLDNEIPAAHDFRVNEPRLTGWPELRGELPDGGLVVASGFYGFSDKYVLTRYDASGSLVSVGLLPELLMTPEGSMPSIVELADGGVILSGEFELVEGVGRPGIARFHPDGRFDPSFNPPPDSQLTGSICEECESPKALLVQSGDRVIVWGSDGRENTCLLRLLPDGQIDPTFPAAPHEALCHPDFFWPHPDGGFLIYHFRRLWRFTEDGALDPTFHAPEISHPNIYSPTHDLAVLADGRILTSVPKDGVPQLVRLKADGALDPEFTAITKAQVRSNVLPDGSFLARMDFDYDISLRMADGRPADLETHGFMWIAAHLFPSGLALGEFSRWFRLADLPRTAVALVASNTPYVWNQEIYIEPDPPPDSSAWIVRRLGETTRAARVRVRTRDGTAQAGVDYTPFDEVIEFAALELSRTVELRGTRVPPARSRTFSVELVEPEGFEQVAPPVTVVLLGTELAFATPGVEPFVSGWNRLVVDSPGDSSLTIEASDDLTSWNGLPLIRPIVGRYRWEGFDPNAANRPHRFYRARPY